MVVSAYTRAGKPVEITGSRGSARGSGSRLCCICCCLCRYYRYLLYKLAVSAQSVVTVQLVFFFRLSVKICSRSALAAGPENPFSSCPEPAVGGPVDTGNILTDNKGRSSLVRELQLCHNDCEELYCRVCCTV